MKYMGSKARLSKHLIPIILKDRKPGQYYVEPFVGGANMIDKVKGNRIGGELNKYISALLIKLSEGWEPPKNITQEMFLKVKANKDDYEPHLVGYIGTQLSFGSVWFCSYRKDGGTRNYSEEAYRNVMKQARSLKGIQFICSSYEDLEIPPNSIIYCDPPYEGTDKYRGFEQIDHPKFWDWCRAKVREGHKVYISEMQAPADFIPIWELNVKSAMAEKTGAKKLTEKLFIHKSQNNMNLDLLAEFEEGLPEEPKKSALKPSTAFDDNKISEYQQTILEQFERAPEFDYKDKIMLWGQENPAPGLSNIPQPEEPAFSPDNFTKIIDDVSGATIHFRKNDLFSNVPVLDYKDKEITTQHKNYGLHYKEEGKVVHTITTEPDYTNMPEGMKEGQQLNGIKDHGLENVSFHPEKSNLVPVDTAEVKWEKEDDHYVTVVDPDNISSKVIKGNFVLKGDRVVFEQNDLGAFAVADPNNINDVTKDLLNRRFPGCSYYGTSDQVVYETLLKRAALPEITIPATTVDPVLILAHEEYLKTHKGHVSFKRFRDEIYPKLDFALTEKILKSDEPISETKKEFKKVTLDTKEGPKDFMMPVEKTALRSTFLHKLKAFGTKEGFHAVDEIDQDNEPAPVKGNFGAAWLESLDKMEEAFKAVVPEEQRGPTIIMSGAIAPGIPAETIVLQSTPDDVNTEVLEKEVTEEFIQEAEKVSEFYNTSIQEESEVSLKEVFQAQAETIPPPPFNLPDDDVIRLTILGDPQAQKRSRTTVLPGSKFARHYDPSAGDKSDFLSMIQQHAPAIPWDCPVRLDIYFYFSRPKAHFNSKGEVKPNAPLWKTGKPDRDNLDKFVMDAMSKVYFKDDSYVCDGELKKRYDLKPRTEIILSKLEL